MIKQEATNTFQEGLLMDMNPLTTPNTVMTKCLNGTLITYNGNEQVLQNDMGNAKIEGACLPEGYIPLGTTQLGGIIYIVSYNPIINKCQIGSFPSPQRDFSTKYSELKISSLTQNTFFGEKSIQTSDYNCREVKNLTSTLKINDEDFELAPGDLFKVVGNVQECLTAIQETDLSLKSIYRNPKMIRLTLQSVDKSGKAKDITDLQWYPFTNGQSYFIENADVGEEGINKYYLKNPKDNKSITSTGFNAYRGNHNGKIQIKAELEAINTFSVTYNYIKTNEEINLYFDTNWTYENPLEEERNSVNIDNILIMDSSGGENGTEISGTKTNKQYEYVKNRDGFDAIEKGFRANIGDDLPFKFKYSPQNITGSQTYEVYPIMKYGNEAVYLSPLKRSITVDFDKLGSEEFTLEGYKYYVENDNVKIDLSQKLYPSSDFEITESKIRFYDLNKLEYNKYAAAKMNYKGKEKEYLVLETVPSFSQKLGEDIDILPQSGWQSVTVKFDDAIQKEKCYIIDISFKYREKTYHLYRLLHTSKVFNTAYNTYTNFNELKLQDYLKIIGSVDVRQKNLLIEHQPPEYSKNVVGDKDGSIRSKIDSLYSAEFNVTSNFKDCFKTGEFTSNIKEITSSYGDLSIIYNKKDLNLTAKPQFTPPITASLNNSSLSLKGTLLTPFRIGIVNQSMTSQYVLRPLTQEQPYYMGYVGVDKSQRYVLSRTMIKNESQNTGLAQWWNSGNNGDAKCVLKLPDMIDIYSYINSHFTESDYVPLIYNINYTKDSGDRHYFGVKRDTNNSQENWNQNRVISCILLRQGSSLLQMYINTIENGNTQNVIPVISDYYKLVNTQVSITDNVISDLNIYDKFIVNNCIKYTISGVEVKYSDIILNDIEEDEEPNLRFTNNNIDLESQINWTINNVQELLNLQQPETIIVVENNSGEYNLVTLDSINQNRVYKLNSSVYTSQSQINIGNIDLTYSIENGILKITDNIEKNNICYVTTWYDNGSEHIEAASNKQL